MTRYGEKAQKKVKRAMRKRKKGTLRSSSGKKVTSRKQAVAIGLSEAREAGGKVPSKKKKKSVKKKSSAKKASGRKKTSGAKKKSSASRTKPSSSRKKSTRKKSAGNKVGDEKTHRQEPDQRTQKIPGQEIVDQNIIRQEARRAQKIRLSGHATTA